jgi:hypothetical protein
MVLAVTLLAAVAAGCATTEQAAVHHKPTPRSVLQITKNVPCYGAHETLAGPAAVKRFHPVTAVECFDGVRTYPDGQWRVRIRQVAVSSVAKLQQYFEQHSVTTHPRNFGCTLNLVTIQVPVFVDAQGHRLVPEVPVDACHHPLGYLDYRRQRSKPVRWRVVSVHRIRLMISAPALAADCAMQIKNLMYGWVAPSDVTQGGPLFAQTPRTVRICIYRTPANDLEVGNFVRGLTLNASQTPRLLGAMTGAAPDGACADQRTFALVHVSSGLEAPVELGGCWRVARPYPNHGVGGADAAVVRSILGSG